MAPRIPVAPKASKKLYAADYKGVDAQSSILEETIGNVNRAVNYEFASSNSLRGRVGCQIAGANGSFFGIFPYSYTRTQDEYQLKYQVASGVFPNQTSTLGTTKISANGATVNRLIAINNQMWVLDEMVIPVSYVSGTYPFTWYTTVTGSLIRFILKANGATILSSELGDGVYYASAKTIYTLLGEIDALAELSVNRGTRGVCPPFAIYDASVAPLALGDVGYGDSYRITVDAGHTFYPGDIITYRYGSTGILCGGYVIARAATTIDFVGYLPSAPADNDVLGYMGQYAASFPISTVTTAASGSLSLVFPYWRLIPFGDKTFGQEFLGPYDTWISGPANSVTSNPVTDFAAPPVSTLANNCLYVASSSIPSDNSNFWGNLAKTDGVSVMRAGACYDDTYAPNLRFPFLTITPVAGGALPAGTYKYKAITRRYDAQGNIVEGTPGQVESVVIAAGQKAQISYGRFGYNVKLGFMARSCFKNTTAAPAAGDFFYVDDNTGGPRNAFIQPGDPVCLLDNAIAKPGLYFDAAAAVPVGTLHKTVCTDYDGASAPSSIRVADSSGYTILNNTAITSGLTIVILRTTAGGNTFYELCEIPLPGYATLPYPDVYDNVLDADLSAGVQYIEPEIGKEHNPPPLCSLVCQHQGGLVVARGFNSPNTVSFSTAEGIEYFPLASNSFDVPSTQSGLISAIASDTNDRLAVFKNTAYYDVVGDLDGGAFSVNIKNEGDYGIASQASLVRANGVLIGLSKQGFVRINDGILDSMAFKGINARLINQNYYYNFSCAVNDASNRSYICSIPVSGNTIPISLVLDYSKDEFIVFDRSHHENIDSAGGMAVVDNVLYHMSITNQFSVFKRLIRFNGNSPTGEDRDSFIDNTYAINYVLESEVINMGEPGLYKTPIRIRVWSVPNDYVVDAWTAFSYLIETAASPFAQYIGGSNPGSSSVTISFPTVTTLKADAKLVNVKTNFYLVRLTTNEMRRAPFFTGWELMFAEDYKKDDLIK